MNGLQVRSAGRLRTGGHRRAILAGLALLLAVPVLARSGGGYDLSWCKVAGGGGTASSGGAYALGGTAGQADAGEESGGEYSLGGGFWDGGVVTEPEQSRLYLPLVMRRSP